MSYFARSSRCVRQMVLNLSVKSPSGCCRSRRYRNCGPTTSSRGPPDRLPGRSDRHQWSRGREPRGPGHHGRRQRDRGVPGHIPALVARPRPDWCPPGHLRQPQRPGRSRPPGPARRRCRVLFVRNVFSAIPQGAAEMVAATIRTLFAQPTEEQAHRRCLGGRGLRGVTGQPGHLLDRRRIDRGCPASRRA